MSDIRALRYAGSERPRDTAIPSIRSGLPGAALCLAAALLALGAGEALAARVFLKNGNTVEGQIITEIPDQYVLLRTTAGEIRLPWRLIREVDREDSVSILIQQGDKLLALGHLHEALKKYQSGLEIAPGDETLARRIAEAEKRIEAQELALFSQQFAAATERLKQRDLAGARAILRPLADQEEMQNVARRAREILAQSYYQEAERALDHVDYRAAERALRQALELDPMMAKARVELGRMLAVRQEARAQALQELEKGLETGADEFTEPEINQIRWEIAKLAEELNDPPKALDQYKRIYDSDPRFNTRLVDRIVLMYETLAEQAAKEEPQRAISLLREALDFQSLNATVRFRLAQLLIEQGDYEAALDQLDQIKAINGRLPNVSYLASFCLMRLGRVLEARERLLVEISLNPRHYEALCDLGQLNYNGGDIKAAEDNFYYALAANPGGARALLGMAKVKRRQNDRLYARTLLEQVLNSDPRNREANIEMGNILKMEKSYNDARKFFDKVIEELTKEGDTLTPENRRLFADALNSRGEVFLLLDQPRTARNDFEEALKRYPDYPPTIYNIGESYLREGATKENLARAEEFMIRARELDPQRPEFAQGLGILYHQYMSQMDGLAAEKKREYMDLAIEHYQDYLRLGGSDTANVKKWIEECGGRAKSGG